MFWVRFGCSGAYKIPAGGGKGRPKKVVVRKVIKVKRKRFLVNPYSAILFDVPPPQKMKLKLKELTHHAYAVGGGGGAGKGKGAGYGGGTPGGKVRFIRLEYRGGDWNQDMGDGADNNMLIQFHVRTGIPVADMTESVTIHELGRFKKDQEPPFIYITGRAGIEVSKGEVRTLRRYLLKKRGMIFADNGGGHFHSSFMRLMNLIAPEIAPVDIANDDPLYQCYYQLPNGAPPLWHHSGWRALGWKYQGRWIAFYHQGDVNDAWKDGHSGTSEEAWELAYQLGVNVIHYSITRYLQMGEEHK